MVYLYYISHDHQQTRTTTKKNVWNKKLRQKNLVGYNKSIGLIASTAS